jgi:hypothetical protein
MTKFKLKKGIPLPNRKYNSRYARTLREMDIGDSFVVPYNKSLTKRIQLLRLNANASYIGKESGWKFALRCLDRGISVWRTE